MVRTALLAIGLAAAAPAFAHPAIVSATPAANATVAAPAQISLSLSEPVVAKLSGASITMTGMPGMANHAPMAVPAKTSVAADGKTLMVQPARKLAAGTYVVDWHAVSSDTHRVTGKHPFTVK